MEGKIKEIPYIHGIIVMIYFTVTRSLIDTLVPKPTVRTNNK